MNLTLRRAIDLFLGEQIISTRKSYMYVLRSVQDYLGPARPLETITPDQLIEYMQMLRTRKTIKSVATLNKYVKTIRTFFNWCIRNNFIQSPSPASGIRRVRENTAVSREKAMPDDTYMQLLDYAKWDTRYLALVLFLGDTGCRIGGAAGLRWSDIDFEKRQATVTEKGKPPRPVFFGDACASALIHWRRKVKLSEDGFVFNKTGKRMTNDSLGQLFSRICQRAGIGTWGPHSLRHRKGHQFADNKVAPSLAAMALGHENPMTTLEYYYPHDWARVQQEIEKLAQQADKKKSNVLKFTRTAGES